MPYLTQKLKDEKEIGECLRQLITEMDAAIEQAIENPLLFLDGPFLHAIESRCASLEAIEDQAAETRPAVSPLPLLYGPQPSRSDPICEPDSGLRALVWEVRGRAGRLQRLLDSASQFYSTCFSPRRAECLDYGVHGEWGQVVNPSHLAIDC